MVVAVALVALLGFIVLATSAAIATSSTAQATVLWVLLVFALAVALGLGGQFIRLSGARLRLDRLKSELGAEAVLITAFWNPTLWGYLKLGDRGTIFLNLARWMFASVGVSTGSAGIAFWRGTSEPQRIREIPWDQIEQFDASAMLSRGKKYSALRLELTSGERLPMQIASTRSTLWPLATDPELVDVSKAVAATRTVPPQHGETFGAGLNCSR